MKTSIQSSVRLALIGSGNIAKVHVEAVALIPEARLVAVCVRNEDSARQLAKPEDAKIFASVESLLAARLADAVLVATPSGAHAESVLPALRAGYHVLCEKPLEITSTRCGAMIAEAEQAGKILAGFFPLRCSAGAQAIKEAVDQGRFGRLTFLSARVKWWRDAAYYKGSSWRGTWQWDGGGALMNQGIHAVDLLQWLGGPIAKVSAQAGTLGHDGIEVEDTLAASVQYASGALGTIAASTSCYPGLDFSLEVSGTDGTAILVNNRIEKWSFREERSEDAAVRIGGGEIGGGAADPRAISCEGHRRQIEAFCRAIVEKGDDVIDGWEAARTVAIVEAAYASVRTGHTEEVHYL